MKIGNGLDLQNKKISNVLDPTSGQDAATKNYVDNSFVKRVHNSTGAETILDIRAVNYNVKPFRVGNSSTSYGFYYLYEGQGSGDANYLTLFSENASIDDFWHLRYHHTSKVIDIGSSLYPDANASRSLGKAGYSFLDIYGINIYENGTALSSKYLQLAGGTLTGNLAINKTDAKIESYGNLHLKAYSGVSIVIDANGNDTDSIFALKKDLSEDTILSVDQTGAVTLTGTLDLGSHKITNVLNPETAQDAATKKYVDDAIGSVSGGDTSTLKYSGATKVEATASGATVTGDMEVTTGVVLQDGVDKFRLGVESGHLYIEQIV